MYKKKSNIDIQSVRKDINDGYGNYVVHLIPFPDTAQKSEYG